MQMKNWQWWKLYTRVKPLLTQARAEDEMKQMQENYEANKLELEKTQKRLKEIEEQNVTLLQQKNDMFAEMQASDSTSSELEEKIALLVNQRGEQAEELAELESRLKDLEGGSEALVAKLDKKEEELNNLKKNNENLELGLHKVHYHTHNYTLVQSIHRTIPQHTEPYRNSINTLTIVSPLNGYSESHTLIIICMSKALKKNNENLELNLQKVHYRTRIHICTGLVYS